LASGIYQIEGNLTIIRSEIDNNISNSGSGAIYFYGGAGTGSLVIDSSSIYSNQGVGVISDGGYTKIVNSTISSNTKGGVSITTHEGESDSGRIVNSTIVHNGSASTLIGGVLAAGTGSPIILHNTIVAKNKVNGLDKDVAGIFHTGSVANFIGIITGSTGLTDNSFYYGTSTPIDPNLSALGSWGGPTKTHKPLSGSDVINQGRNDVVDIFELEFDQRLFKRTVGSSVDIGAVELAFDEF
jgi:hypothetical protein